MRGAVIGILVTLSVECLGYTSQGGSIPELSGSTVPHQEWASTCGNKQTPAHLGLHLGVTLLGCHNQVPHSRWLQPQKCIASQLWSLEVRDPLMTVRVNVFRLLSQLLPASGVPRLIGDILRLHFVFRVCLSRSKFPLVVRTSVILD